MNAQEARELSENKKTIKLDDVFKAIKACCNRGLTSVWYYQILTQEQKEQLKELGYTLSEEGYDRNEYLIKISW